MINLQGMNFKKLPIFLLLAILLSFGIANISDAFPFSSAVNYPGGTDPRLIVSADFNGDNVLDLAETNYSDSNVSVFLGSSTATGTFNGAVNYPVDDGPQGIVTADFNDDGILDLATANVLDNDVSILFGSSTSLGTFDAVVNNPVGGQLIGITTGDFNEDSLPDIAVTVGNGTSISVLLSSSTATGTLETSVPYTVGLAPFGITNGDFNGDGLLDLATANVTGSNISILLGSSTATGTFNGAVNYSTDSGPIGIITADFNQDSFFDLAVANSGTGKISVFFGSSTTPGIFDASTTYSVGSSPTGITTEDFNGDSILDLAVTNQGSANISILLGSSTATGTFNGAVNYPTGLYPTGITAGDFNKDSIPDLAVANQGSSTVSVLINELTLYFNNAVDSLWDTLGNWWLNASFSIPAITIPGNGDIVYLGAAVASTGTPSVPVTLSHTYVAASSTGGGSFVVTLSGINGDVTFYDNSGVQSYIRDNATFYDTSKNGGGYGNYVYGLATFYDSTYNSGYLYGDAIFHDTSFNGNYIFGTTSSFYDLSVNNHEIDGNAFFDCSATNNSIVLGTITYGADCPTIDSASLASDNSYIDITVSEPVWGDTSSTTVLTSGKFTLVFNQNGGSATGATISSITKTTGGVLDGSETTIRINLSITGTPNGFETIAVKPLNGTSIYNAAGDPMRPEQTTGAKTLNNQTTPTHHRSITAFTSSSESTTTQNIPTSTTTLTISTPTTTNKTTSPVYQFSFTKILRLGSIGDEVKQLQIFLNTHDFPLAKTGNGSKGKETTYFGLKTKQALIKFQESNAKDILTPQNLTKGTGIFWIYSKKFVNEILSNGN